MAMKWSDVAANPAFQALSFDEQEEARNQYFNEVVAPRVSEDEVEAVRGQFLADTQQTLAPVPDTGDETARLAARYKAPEKPGLIARLSSALPKPVDPLGIGGGSVTSQKPKTGVIASIGAALKPEFKSVMDGYEPTPQERQAEVDKRLSYGAGPISQKAVATANEVRSSRGQMASQDPTVNKVVKAMDARGEKSFADIVDSANKPEVVQAVRDEKADEFRTAGEWAADTLSSLSQGAVGLVQLPINIIAPSSEIASTLRKTQKELQAQESDVLKAQREQLRERVQNEDGFLDKYAATVVQLVTSPALGLSEAVKQIPNFLGIVGASRLVGAASAGGVGLVGRASPTVALGEAISGGAIQAGARAAGTTAGGVGASMVMAGGDAAGGVYDKLTDPRQTPLSVWQENPDYQELVASGKTSEQAIVEIATAKARMAALVTAPLGLLGFMGAEAAVASRGLGRATAEALTAAGAGKMLAKDLIGEQLEEGGTQFGGNVISRTVDPSQKLSEGVPEAMATALVTSAPFSAVGAASQYQEARAAQAPDFAAERQAVGLFDVNNYDPTLISPEQTMRRAADVGPSAPAREINFTPAGSPTDEAGLVPIVVPIPNRSETTDVSTLGGAGAAPAVGGFPASDQRGGGLGIPGLDAAGTGQLAGGNAGLPAANAGANVPAGSAGGQQAASLTLPRVSPRATDQDLLARTEAAIAAPENNNAVVQPVEQWVGRKGDGYVTEADAAQALPGRQRMFPALEWSVEQMPSGKFRLAGYEQQNTQPAPTVGTMETGAGVTQPTQAAPAAEPITAPSGKPFSTQQTAAVYAQQNGITGYSTVKMDGGWVIKPTETTLGTQTPQALQGQTQGQQAPAVGGAATTASSIRQPQAGVLRNTQTGGSVESQQIRDSYQAELDAVNEPIKLNAPTPEAEAQVEGFGNALGKVFGIDRPVVAFSDSTAPNGFAFKGQAFVNTADVEIGVQRTSLHEFTHLIEAIAEADTQTGKTGTAAQNFIKQIYSVFDDVSDDFKRVYVERYLHAADLKDLKGDEREAAIQGYLKSQKLRSEITADFMGNRANDRAFLEDLADKDPNGFESFVQKWISLIDSLMQKLRGAPAQERGPQAAVDRAVKDLAKAKMVARDALIAYRKGSMKERRQAASSDIAQAQGFKPDVALMNDAQPMASNRAAPQTPEFKKFFGDSKVVDTQGKPLVVYHGTTGDFSEFDGYSFLTPNPELANTFAKGDGGNVMPVYLSLQNPAVLDMLPPTTKAATARKLRSLENRGYDGVIVEYGADGKRMYIAFRPEQIKSATGNNGQFDAANPDIRRSNRAAEGNTPDNSFEINNADVMPPEQINADGIKFSLRKVEEINDAPEITMKDLVGQTVFPILADLTAAGYVYMGKELRGGPYYTLLPSNSKAGLIWANDGKGVASIKNKKAARGVIGLIVAMKQDSHATNNTVANIIFRAVEDEIQKGSVAKADIPKLDEIVRGLATRTATKTRKVDGKKVKETKQVFPKFADFPGFSDRAASEKFLRAMPFDARGLFFEEMTKPTVEDLGLGVVRKVINDTVEPDLRGLNMGDVVMAIRFDPNADTIELGKKTDTPEHDSYRYGVKGEVIGKFKRPISFENVFVDLMAERRAAGKDRPAGNYRSLTLRKPEQLITEEIAGGVGQEKYKTFKTPAEAKAAVAAAAMDWKVIDRPAAAGVKEFLRTARIYGEGRVPSFGEAKMLIKDGRLRIFRLANTESWFSIESRGNKRVMTHAMVAQPGVERDMLFGDMVFQARANGATHIEEGGKVEPITEQKAMRRVAPIVSELSEMPDADIKNLGIDPKEVDRLNGLIGQGEEEFSAEALPVYSNRAAPAFYSQLERTIANVPAKLATQPASQWALWLDSNAPKQGVKKDEMEWSGIKDYLTLRGKDKVTSAELQAYLADSGVRVSEEMLGDIKDFSAMDDAQVVKEYTRIRGYAPEANGEAMSREEILDELEGMLDEDADDTRYSKYTLPGGENYREVLLTLPGGALGADATRLTELNRLIDEKTAGYDAMSEDERRAVRAEIKPLRDERTAIQDKKVNYRSSHWDQPNVLAHIRVNDRTDADGKRVLFVEEVQSDWGQDGKKKGFGKVTRFEYEAVQDNGQLVRSFREKDEAEAFAKQRGLQIKEIPFTVDTGIPVAPFVTKTEGWLNLALKRIAMLAVEGGYDKVAFVNGEQSADRYDLSKQIQSIAYSPEEKLLDAWDNNRRKVMRREITDESQLEEYVGKEVAKRLLAQPLVMGKHLLDGEDIKVGGEGMKAFYDQIVPQAITKLLPKLGGEKLGSVGVPLPVGNGEKTPAGAVQWVINVDGREYNGYSDEGVARQELAELLEDGKNAELVDERNPEVSQQPGFDVTDKMRETVGQGLPMFSKRAADEAESVATPEVRTSNRRQKLIGSNFELPATGAVDTARIKLQDDGLRMKRVIEAVEAKKGSKVGEAQNFYDANTLMPGRIQAAMDDFRDNVMRPLIDKAVKFGIDLDELALYAYAKHAEERNAYIASINKRMPDGGSGMTDAHAKSILQLAKASGDEAKFEELHQDLMAITSTTRQVMLAEGLITQDEFDALDGAYENYIPLRGLENVDENTGAMRPGIGRGINVRGGETIRAMGRKSQASDLIENVIRDYQRVIMRVEKNDVGKVLLDFVLSNPDPDLWGVDVERNKAAFNKATGTVQYTKSIEKGEDTIGVKVGGQQVYIKLADPELARAIRQAWKEETSGLERATLAVSGWWNNWLRNVLTRYNPAFAAINIPRDALWSGTSAALAELGPKGLAKYLANYGKALMASARQEAGIGGTANKIIGNQQMDQRFQEFRNAGSITGGFYMRSLDDINKDLRNEMLLAGAKSKNTFEAIKSLPPYKLATLTARMLEFMGSASENATRFALYQAAREVGKTPTQAALLAKDGTTNFNRKGEWGGALNNMYLFFNAAVQGNAQLVKVLKSPAVQASMAGVAGVGMMLALYGASAGGEDDDGEAYWDKVPSYVKERNLVFMLPPGDALADGIERAGKRGRYFTIPVQYGFNIFPNAGYVMADVWRNAQDPKRGMTPTKAALHMTSTVFGSVNPFGGAVDFGDGVQVLLAAMPTLIDLPVQLINERGTFGSPSAPERSAFDVRPDSSRMFVSQMNTVPEKVAKALNEMGGGNEAKPGKILGVETSVTPGTIQTLISATTGGLGSFVEQVGSSVIAMTGDDKDLKAAKIPFLNKFYGEVDESANIRSAGDRMREIKKLSDQVKAQQKVGLDPELDSDEERLLGLAGMQEAYQKQQSAMRKAEIAIIKDKDMTEAEKKLQRRQLQVERDRLATDVNREYLKSIK